MFRKLLFTVSAIAVLFASGCASVPMAPAAQDAALKTFAAPPADQAGLYIYRNSLAGQALKKNVYVDGEFLGESANKVYFYKAVAPGQHSLSTESEFSDNALTLDVKGGINYFVRQYIKLGVFVGGAGLEVVSEEEGKKNVLESRLAKQRCERHRPAIATPVTPNNSFKPKPLGDSAQLEDVSRHGDRMTLSRLVPMQPVKSMPAGVAFYEKLGFVIENRNEDWVGPCCAAEGCQIMLDQSINLHAGISRTSVIYIYPEDLADFHRPTRKSGPAVPDLDDTFYGMTEFRMEDPNGNRLWIGHDRNAADNQPISAQNEVSNLIHEVPHLVNEVPQVIDDVWRFISVVLDLDLDHELCDLGDDLRDLIEEVFKASTRTRPRSNGRQSPPARRS